MNPLTDFIALIGRILLAFLFVQGGYSSCSAAWPGLSQP